MIRVLVIVGALLALLAGTSLFTVLQIEQALVLQFGEAKRVIVEPGLHMKIPFVQNVVSFDRRLLDLDPPAEEVIAGDQKRLVVDTYVRYRISKPLEYYQSVRSETVLRGRLTRLVIASLRRAVGNVSLLDLLSEDRARIMAEIRDEVNGQARSFGIDVVDVRIRRADLPQANSQAVFERMRSEREREAKLLRAQGEEEAQRIRAGAERDREVILAEARKKAQILRGEGDSESVRIYADAFGRDPEFFNFYRSMEAYRETLADGKTTLVLSPDSDFFRYFDDALGR
ncbi:MAG: protease modulator HflC [Deltaproteobacteria bacterium]|nr:MAG: protease modulator HflC [Deltaproteobacteria bacterium]